MRQRCIHTKYWSTAGAEKQTRKETTASHTARKVAAARIKSAKRNEETVGRDVTVTAEDPVEALPEISDHNDVSLVIAGAGLEPSVPFAHLIGRSQIGVAVLGSDFQTAELVNQEEVDHARDSIRAVHSRGAILEDVHVIDHRKWYEVNVRACTAPGRTQRTEGDTLAVDQNQSLLWQQAAQVELNGTIAAVADVQVNSATGLLRNEFLKIGRIANTQFLDVLRTVRVHRVRARLFGCGNVRTRYDDAFDLSRRCRTTGRRRSWSGGSRQLREGVGCEDEWKSDARHESETNESKRFQCVFSH